MSGVKEERRGRKSAGRGKKEDKNAKAPKKQKVTTTQVIDKLPETIAESALLTQLQDLEKKIDYHVVRKQIELGETFRARTNRVTRNLRLTISNTYDNQAATYHIDPKADSSLYEPPSWTLRLEGHVVDDPSRELASAMAKGVPPTSIKPRRRFTSFFKKIVIILDDRMEENIIEWERPVTGVEGDGFEIKRACDFESKARIQLYIDYNPPRYNLTQPLSSILNVHTETRTRVIVLLWQYIKLHRLIDPNDKRQVILNEPLKRVFGMDRVAFAAIPDLLREHLSPPEPLEFNYDIRLSGDPSTFEQSFSLQIEEDDDPILHQLQLTMARRKEVQLCDEIIAKNLAAIHEHLKKREFMYAFAMDPVNFLNKLIKNQIRDLRIAKSEEAREQEEERYSMFFMQPYTPEAVSRFLMSINPNLLSSGVPGAGQGDGNQ